MVPCVSNAVALSYSMKYIFETTKKETYFAGSDSGWVVGHTFIAYGPVEPLFFSRGNQLILRIVVLIEESFKIEK